MCQKNDRRHVHDEICLQSSGASENICPEWLCMVFIARFGFKYRLYATRSGLEPLGARSPQVRPSVPTKRVRV